MFLQETTNPEATRWLVAAQFATVVIVIGVIAYLAVQIRRTGVGPTALRQDERSWLDYGSFYVVALGITVVVSGFLVTLLFANRFGDLTSALGFLTALIGVITGLVGTYFGIKASSDEAQVRVEQQVAEADKRVESEPQKAKPSWDLARATLDQYFQNNLRQTWFVFWLSVSVMVVGFVVVIFGVLRAVQSPGAILPATVASLAGVITEFIGATFLLIYRSAIQQAMDFTKALERINVVGMALHILDTLPEQPAPDDLKSKTKATLVELIVQHAYEGSRGDQRNTSTG
jgi:hypothetical protein